MRKSIRVERSEAKTKRNFIIALALFIILLTACASPAQEPLMEQTPTAVVAGETVNQLPVGAAPRPTI